MSTASEPRKLDLDPATVAPGPRPGRARPARPIVDLATQHTTVSVERATLRLAGLAGADPEGTPVGQPARRRWSTPSATRSASSTASRCRSGTRCCAARPTTCRRSPRRRRAGSVTLPAARGHATPTARPRGRPQAGRRRHHADRRAPRASASG